MDPDVIPGIEAYEVPSKQEQGWQLLDVRTEGEWAQGRIAGSTHIPMDELIQRLDEVGDQVVCICAVGGRSARVTAYLNSVGREAVNLDGGVQAWHLTGRSLEV